MSQVDERIERLIVRRLDGELTDDESLELDRELLRSPQARQLLGEYQEIDDAAVDALAAALGVDSNCSSAFLVAATPPRRTRHSWLWWTLPAAIAAGLAVAAVLMPRPQADLQVAKVPAQPVTTQANHIERAGHEATLPGRTGVQQANYRTGRLDRAVDQDLLYIVGDDGNIYVIDRRHVRTARRPGGTAAIRQVSGDL